MRSCFGDASAHISQLDIEFLMESGDLQHTDRVSIDDGETWISLALAMERHFVDVNPTSRSSAGTPLINVAAVSAASSKRATPLINVAAASTSSEQTAGEGNVDSSDDEDDSGTSTAVNSATNLRTALRAGTLQGHMVLPPKGFSFIITDNRDGWVASEVELTEEFLTMHRTLSEVYTAIGRVPVFPDFRSKLALEVYGDLEEPSSFGHHIISQCHEAVNACAHLQGHAKRMRTRQTILYYYIMSTGFWLGRECPEAFERFSARDVAKTMLAWDMGSEATQDQVVLGVVRLLLTQVSRADTQSYDSPEQTARFAELMVTQSPAMLDTLQHLYSLLQMPVFTMITSLVYLERAIGKSPRGYYTGRDNRLRFFLPATLIALKTTCVGACTSPPDSSLLLRPFCPRCCC